MDAPSGRLGPRELAEAVVMADLAVLVLLVARLTPFAGVGSAVAAVPVAVLATRHRVRAVVVAGWIVTVLVFLLAGFGTAQSALVAVLWGAVAGRAWAGGWSAPRAIAVTLAVGWSTVTAATVAVLAALPGFRRLILDQIAVQWDGLATLLRRAGAEGAASAGDRAIGTILDRWFVTVPALQLLLAVGLALLVRAVAAPTLARVDASFAAAPANPGRPGTTGHPETTGPGTAVELAGVSVVRAGVAALRGVDLTVEPGTVTVVVGPNGAGKSTLLGVLAGTIRPTSGTLRRPGSVALGRPGGTAVVGQRPETQVVGARVRDDLGWGLDRPLADADLAAALAAVGLAGWADRSTLGLSGGELQRVAVAAALVRRPQLVLSDESTSMLDPDGRDAVRAALRTAADAGAAVVHVTHVEADLAIADRVVELDAGRLVERVSP